MLGNPSSPTSPRPEIAWEEQEEGEPVKTGDALPPSCFRVLHDPFNRAVCDINCAGRQRDDSCLCDIIRAADAAGVKASFAIARDGVWEYDGPAL